MALRAVSEISPDLMRYFCALGRGGVSQTDSVLFACYIVKTMVAFVSFSRKVDVSVTKNGSSVPPKHNMTEIGKCSDYTLLNIRFNNFS